MKNNKLNNLAVAARNGCETSMWGVKLHFMKLIVTLSDKHRNSITSQERFENDCYKQVEFAVLRFRPGREGNIETLVRRNIGRMLKQHRERFAKKCRGIVVTTTVDMRQTADVFEEIEVEDVVANVASTVLQKEQYEEVNKRITHRVAAASDPRVKMAFEAWIRGFTDISDLARRMTETLGRSFEANRKFLTRLKANMVRELAEYEFSA